MQASVDPQAALKLLREEHAAVQHLIDTLSADEMTRPNTIRYGLYGDQEYSFKDLLAHMSAYEELALEALAAWRDGEKHPIVDEIRTRAREIHYASSEDRAHLSLDEMIERHTQTARELESVYENMTQQEWQQPAPFPTSRPMNLGGMLESIVVAPPRPMYRHLPVHIPDTEAYVRRLQAK